MNPSAFCNNINKYYTDVGGDLLEDCNNDACTNETPVTPLDHLSVSEIKHHLKRLNTTKATSTEDFPTWVSYEGLEDICIPLQSIINSMLTSSEFPDKWKRSQIKPSQKISMPSQYKDFRPISLLFHLGKLAEDIIINKMRNTLSNIIDPSQFAYQKKIGTVDALIQLLDDYTSELDKPSVKFMQLAGIDFSKAFDRLQPPILIDKMRNYGFNESITKLVANFLQNRQQSVKYNDQCSSYVDFKVRAPQGTKLGPVLWLIYCNDLTAQGFSHVKYADDTSFYTPIKNHTNQSAVIPALQAASDWSAENSMLLNTSKTVVLNTCLSSRFLYDDCITFDDTVLNPSTNIKFLGVHLDTNLSFNTHADKIISKCNSRIFLMKKLKTIGLNAEGLKMFYISNIRSVMSYAAPCWYTFLSDTNKQRLETIQKTAVKVILPEFSYEEILIALNLPTINDFLFNLADGHFSKVLSNPSHPLHDRIIFNNVRTSSRSSNTFRPKLCRTEKRRHSFFNYFMEYRNNKFLYRQ